MASLVLPRLIEVLLLVLLVGCSSVEAHPLVASFRLLQGSTTWEIGEPRILPDIKTIISLSRPLSIEEMRDPGFSYCDKLLTLNPHEVFTFTIPIHKKSCLIYLKAPDGFLLEQRTHPVVWFAGCDMEQLRFTSDLHTMVYCDGGYQVNFHGYQRHIAIMFEGVNEKYRQKITFTVGLKAENANLPGSKSLESGAREILWRDPATDSEPPPALEVARRDDSLQICPGTCGASQYDASYSIAFGTLVEEGEAPYMARVIVDYETPGRTGRVTSIPCSGTILNSRHVLTAAHCLLDKDKLNWIVNRRYVQTADIVDGEGQEIFFDKFTVHPEYKGSVRHPADKAYEAYDVAVIKLPKDLRLGPNSWPICLAPGFDFTNKRATISGFGQITRDDPEGLWKAGVVIKDFDEKCKEYDSFRIADNMHRKTCTYGISKDSCRGDSGSPLAVSEGTVWYQVGVAIGGFCGSPHHPHFYVNVTTYVDFIRANVQGGRCH